MCDVLDKVENRGIAKGKIETGCPESTGKLRKAQPGQV